MGTQKNNPLSDARGHAITTDSAAAAAAFNDAADKFVRREIDVIPRLQQSLNADPDCAMSQALFGLMLHGARNCGVQPQMISSLKQAHAGHAETSRERLYVKALENAVSGDLFGLIDCFENILQQDPTDLLCLVLCQGELFWLGDMKRSRRITDVVESSWNKETPGYADYLSVRAFDLEETGDYINAESAGRLSVELASHSIWGAHAVAHVLLMQGRHNDGVNWLRGLQNNWQHTNQMKFHLWWHQCLFHLERRENDAVLDTYDHWVRNHEQELIQAVPDLYIDLQNGASMLWRLEHVGVDVGHRWNEMAELVLPRLGDMTSPFTSAHFAMILAAVGQFDDCDRLLGEMHKFHTAADHALASRYGDAAIPAARGAVAHRRGDYGKVLEVMMPARHNFWQMGGSHAQQDVFFQLMVDAAVRLGRKREVNTLLDEIEKIGFAEPLQRVAYETASHW